MEPPACAGAFTTAAKGLHYVWRGWGPAEKATTIGIFNPTNVEWTLQPTTGAPPPGLYDCGCASIGNDLYCFGGENQSSRFNDLHKLNLETFQWSKVHPRNDKKNWPMPKNGCGFTAINDTLLCCFGGYTENEDSEWTNEFHLYDVQEGTSYSNSLFYFVFVHVLRVCQLIKLQAVYTHIISTVGSFNFVITYSPSL